MSRSAHEVILLLEEDPNVADFMVAVLADEGYRAQRAADKLEALRLMAEGSPGLVVIDVDTRDGAGWEYPGELRARYGEGFAILLVGYEGSSLEAREAGANAWLKKPFDLDDFVHTVAHLASSPDAPAAGEAPLR